MKGHVFFWFFRRVVKILIPVVYFAIALAAKANEAWGIAALSGTMCIAVIFYYVLEIIKVGE